MKHQASEIPAVVVMTMNASLILRWPMWLTLFLFLLSLPVVAAHRDSGRGHGRHGYRGPGHHGPQHHHNGAQVHPRRSYIHYGVGYPNYYGYHYGGYGHYGHYYRPSYYRPVYHRPFPYHTPRIYVVPQEPTVPLPPGQRRIIVYNYGGPSEPEGPAHRLDPIPESSVVPPPPQAEPVDATQAWDYLQSADYSKALRAFTQRAVDAPDNGAHKVGFGLAAALSGDQISAVYALRRAFETDPDGAGSVSIPASLSTRLATLASDYEGRLKKKETDLKLRFLHAAASFYSNHPDVAQTTLAGSIAQGETAKSTANFLKHLNTAGTRIAGK